MRSVVTWLWAGNRAYKPAHVDALGHMVRRHLPGEHRFICITDRPPGEFGEHVEVLPMPEKAQALGNLRTPEQGSFPSCYRRLWAFSDEAKVLGDRVMFIDVDVIVCSDLSPLFDVPGAFVGWQPKAEWGGRDRLGGGLFIMNPGSNPEVFDDFNGAESIADAKAAGYRGSDQAWISYKLFGRIPILPEDSGIYSIRDLSRKPPPKDAKIIQFNGPLKPWSHRYHWSYRMWQTHSRRPYV